jgi:hypothetical protein
VFRHLKARVTGQAMEIQPQDQVEVDLRPGR